MNIDSKIKGDLGENFVNEIAYKSFFKYWCYPSPKNENGDKKEICDLLIIFKDICIIFSVKNYEFKGNHLRYFNNTIEKAVRQLNGAYKTLFKKGCVIIKHPDKNEEEFPSNDIRKVFKLVINLGEGVDFYDITRTHNDNDGFITIFDRDTFETITQELDTIPDFIDYLEKRELLFKNKMVKVISPEISTDLNEGDVKFLNENLKDSIRIIGTEKDLLAYFFTNTRNFPSVISENFNDYIIMDIVGAWNEFKKSPKAIKKEFADSSSYFIDDFVLNEVLTREEPFIEEVAKELLSLNRLRRRAVGIDFEEFFDYIKNAPEGMVRRKFSEHNDLAIVFFNFFPEWGENALLRMFDIVFETFAFYYKYRHTTFIVIGVSSDPYFTFQMYKNYEKFTPEVEAIIKANIKELGWFTEYNEQIRNVDEFPD